MATNFLNFTKHAVAGSSKLKATVAGHIFNIKVAENTDNGTIVSKGEYVEPEVYAAAAAPNTFEGLVVEQAANGNWYVEVVVPADAILLLNVPLIYEEGTSQMQNESNFFNAANDIVRGYELYKHDIFELSAEGFDGTVEKGDTVKVDATSKKLKKQTQQQPAG